MVDPPGHPVETAVVMRTDTRSHGAMRTFSLTLALAALLASPPALAHERVLLAQSGKPAPAPEKIHRVEKLADDVYAIITDRGGNMGLVVGDRFCVLIDDQFEPLVPGLLAAIRSVTQKPLKYLVNTHHHGDHTGGNLALEQQVQVIVAHANSRKNQAASPMTAEAAKKGGLPELVFGEADPKAKAMLAIYLGGMELHLVHKAPAHTDGDLMVGIPQRRVLFAGDVFFNGMTPFIDTSAGGSLAGYVENLDYLLSFVPEDSRIVPGHGPVGTKADLARSRDFLAAVQKHVTANPGKTGAELAASFDRKAFPGITDIPNFLSWEAFFDLAAGRLPQLPKK